ncbi:DUF3025 domain-containing protein [Chitinibacter bivalviorum]|uniref:DUF3025 domain-containing protein n=1 Tax=Chitinibacter bivalviorum TaxID=2739434 RepID=A0A7H9BDT1_9NEIS|nr:DUF3025 domain-containing protein [Chitinibacter bivalviorum]QLG86860.1 DUF3025 domain-containing protein [Chitinibacter bivalviorum]
MTNWPSDFFNQHPAFSPIRRHLAQFSAPPDYATWQSIPTVAISEGGSPIRFVPSEQITEYYELAVYRDGMVATRLNWHDTFNAMIWHAFPRSKSALNAMHFRIINSNPAATIRGAARDAATLLDECGLILPYSDPKLLELVTQHQWHDLFVTQREQWGKSISAITFGHANFENLMAPFIGLTGKCWPIAVGADFFNLDIDAQCQQLDAILAQLIASDALQKPKQLPPLPYLGIPDWYAQQDDAFYCNTAYFRPKREKASA